MQGKTDIFLYHFRDKGIKKFLNKKGYKKEKDNPENQGYLLSKRFICSVRERGLR